MEEVDLIFILKLFVWSFSILILGSGAIYLGKRIEYWIYKKFKR